MQIFFRITLLGIFASAGTGLAIALAHHLPATLDVTQVEHFAPVEEVESVVDDKILGDSESSQNSVSIQPPTTVQLQPQPIPYESPVANRVEKLEEKIVELREAAKREHIEKLQEKLQKIELDAQERQRKFEQAASEQKRQLEQNASDQQRQFEETARRQQEMILSLTKTLVAQRETPPVTPMPSPLPIVAQPEAEEIEPIDEEATVESLAQAEEPKRLRIHKDEGDETLSLFLNNDPLREVLEFLSAEGNLNILATESVKGNVTASLSNVSVSTALDAILKSTGYVARKDGNFVYVGKPEDFDRMDQLADKVISRIYRTNYVTAAELEKMIAPMLTPSVGQITVSTPAKVGIPRDDSTTGGDDFAGNEVIMVRDYERVLFQVDEVVCRIDRRPKQVSIEAKILSVNLDDSHRTGVNLELLRTHTAVKIASGSPLASLGSINLSEGGLNIGVLDGDTGLFLHALESVGDTDVIASPHLMVLNKQRAEILIGDQKGFVSTTQTETATTQTVEFLDIGTQLKIRPFISDDGMIRLEVHPELSTGDVKLLGGFALPEKSTTQVTTNVMCPDGCTVVIGGLIREDVADSRNQMPVLGNIPVIGSIFRNQTQTVTRNEIIVLLTPRIVYDPAACEGGNECYADIAHRRATVDAVKMTPIGRSFYGNRYYRLAEASWRAGNFSSAMEYLDLSLYFEPENENAAKLKCKLSGQCAGSQVSCDTAWEEPHFGVAEFSSPSDAIPHVADQTARSQKPTPSIITVPSPPTALTPTSIGDKVGENLILELPKVTNDVAPDSEFELDEPPLPDSLSFEPDDALFR